MRQTAETMISQPHVRVTFFLATFSFLTLSTVVFSRPPGFLAAAWEKSDQKAIYATASTSGEIARHLGLRDAEIDALALPTARWIPLQKTLESSPDQSWRRFKTEGDWTPFLNALPDTDPIKKQWWMGERAASAYRTSAEKGQLKSKAVIPYLIAGLDHPCRSLTARDCVYALAALTKRYDRLQPIYEHPESLRALKEWYTKWWEANQDEDLIVDASLESRIDACFLAACQRVELATGDAQHALHGFKAPALGTISRTGPALRETSYFPHGEHSGIDLGRAGMASWVWAGVVSKSPAITNIPKWPESVLDPAKMMPAGTKEIFHDAVPNSDWQIKVYTNRVSASDIESLVKSLSSTP